MTGPPLPSAPRRLVWLHDPDQARAVCHAAATTGARMLWCGTDAPQLAQQLTPREARGRLGSECDLLVFDAREGFDADAFGALAGTLVGGGTLALLTRPVASWPVTPYATRLRRLLTAAVAELPARPQADQAPPAFPADADPAAVTADQARAVAALLRVATGHRRRPLVLTADRGRGKSAALGIAAARLLGRGCARVLVTAPRPAAAAAVFEQVRRLLGTSHPAGLAFVAADELVRHPRPADLLLVDEAAGLPVALLERLLRHHARIAFATTVHGYEGTGRGFAVRFRAILDERAPGWRELQLTTPVRWPAGDPLEAFTFAALLLDAAPAAGDAVSTATPGDCHVVCWDRDRLAADERRLRELVGLLVLAHYQTRPSDVQRLLDDPAVSVWTLSHDDQVIAAAVVAREGGMAADLAAAVTAGRRRPAGHLLPQALALHEGCTAAPGLRYARVMRIAVHPAAQRRGLGSRLLDALVTQSRDCDFLGVSFGATPGLLRFWQRNGLQPVRVGVQRDAASGTHSVMLLRPGNAPAAALLQDLRGRFFEQLPHLLADGLEHLEPALVAVLAEGATVPAPPARDLADLRAFAAGRRDYAGALGALWRGGWRCLANGTASRLPAAGRAALVMRVLQKRPWAEVARELGVPGRAQVEAVLRPAAGVLAAAGEADQGLLTRL